MLTKECNKSTRVCPPSAASACACIAPISICGRDVACVGVDGRVLEARGACVHYRSCIGSRMTEQRSRLSRRKRGRRQGVEDQRQTCKALSRSGAGSDICQDVCLDSWRQREGPQA